MTPQIAAIVQGITGQRIEPPPAQQVNPQAPVEIRIPDEDLRLAESFKNLLYNNDFHAFLVDNEKQARFELGAIDPVKTPEITLRMAVMKWQTELKRAKRMSDHIEHVETALAEAAKQQPDKKNVDKSKQDDRTRIVPD